MKRDERRAITRQRLTEAALAACLAKGIDDVTVDEIAAAAGVSPRTFFLHFASKAAALFPDHDENLARFRAALAALEGGDDVRRLSALVVEGVRQQSSSSLRQRRFRLVADSSAVRDVDARGDREYEAAVAQHLIARWGPDPEAQLEARVTANVVIGVARAALAVWGSSGLEPVEATRRVLDRLTSAPLTDHGVASGPRWSRSGAGGQPA